MASEEDLTSDSLDVTETAVPDDLLDYVRDKVVDYVKQAKYFSATIQHIQGQSLTLVLSFGNKVGKPNYKSLKWTWFVSNGCMLFKN